MGAGQVARRRSVPWTAQHPFCVACGLESRWWFCTPCIDSLIATAALQAIREWRANSPWLRRYGSH
jgi:hypothetical protein